MKHKDSIKKAPIKPQENTKENIERVLIKCSVCGKEFKKKAGLGGHMWGIHSIKTGHKEEQKQLKSQLELTIKEFTNLKNELTDFKKNYIPKDKIYACPKCNAGIRGYDFKIVS